MSLGNSYSVSFSAALSTNAFDLLNILAPAASQIVLRKLTLSAVTTGATSGVVLGIDIFRNSTSGASAPTPAAIVPTQLLPQTSPTPLAAGSSVSGPSTAAASTASAVFVHRSGWPYSVAEYNYEPHDTSLCVRGDFNQRVILRCSAPDKGDHRAGRSST